MTDPCPTEPSPCPGRPRAAFARAALLALAAWALTSPAAWAGVDRWTPYGPGDGALTSLSASIRGDLYTTTAYSLGEVWQRPASVPSWRWRGAGLDAPGLPGVTALANHPKNPNSLWAVASTPGGTLQNVYRSKDAGASWMKVHSGDAAFQIVRMTVAPTARSVVLLAETGRGTPKRLLRSADLGASWTEVPGVVGPAAAAPDEPGTVYAVAASGLSVVKSVDGGKSFRATGALPVETGDEVRALHATYGRPALVLASFRAAGLFRSTNGGVLWRRAGFRDVGPGTLASEPGNPRKIYATNPVGLYASDLGAQSGSFRMVVNLNFTPIANHEPTELAAVAGAAYFLADGDLYRYASPDSFGAVAETGIEAFGAAELRISSADPSFVALRRYTGCIRDFCNFRTYFSTDGGATFSRRGIVLSIRGFADVADMAFDPAEPNRWLEAIGGRIFLHEPDSTGGEVLVGPIGTVEIAVDGVLLAGGSDGIQVSENAGTTWTTSLAGPFSADPHHLFPGFRRIVDLVTNPYAPERAIARSLEFISGLPHDPGRTVLYKSEDAGRTWSWLRDGGADVEFIPGAPASFYLLFATGAGTELRRSDDFGATSVLLHTFPAADGASDVTTDPSGSGDLYLATRTGVRKSRDGGATWEPTAGGFNAFGPYRRRVGQLQVAPDGRLIAAPVDGGLFENRLSD